MRQCLIILISLLALSGAAYAQIGQGGGPIDITADSVEVDRPNRVAIYTGRVIATQGDSRLRAQKLTLTFGQRAPSGPRADGAGIDDSFGSLDQAIAEDEVFYVTPTERATGDRGIYTSSTDSITLQGTNGRRVQLIRDADVAEGALLTINLATGKSVLQGVAQNGTAGRVRTVINPKETKQP